MGGWLANQPSASHILLNTGETTGALSGTSIVFNLCRYPTLEFGVVGEPTILIGVAVGVPRGVPVGTIGNT